MVELDVIVANKLMEAGCEKMDALNYASIAVGTLSRLGFISSIRPSACEDEGCPHYRTAIDCKPYPGGCIATTEKEE